MKRHDADASDFIGSHKVYIIIDRELNLFITQSLHYYRAHVHHFNVVINVVAAGCATSTRKAHLRITLESKKESDLVCLF